MKTTFGMTNIAWNQIESEEDLLAIDESSLQRIQLILKHSSRCAISHQVLHRFERTWLPEEYPGVDLHFLDLINYRPLSNRIAEKYAVRHESPQVLLIKKGECFFDASHYEIDSVRIKQEMAKA